jgi:surface carbohydrate biosynthesis protein
MNVGIIVDHPDRDLPPLVKLGEAILKQYPSANIRLIPMYFVGIVLKNRYYIFDIIIFNFFRSANIKFILTAKKRNIMTVIYDQEGAGGISGTNITSIIEKNKKYLKYIDLYLFWGKKQLNKFKKEFKNFNLKKTFVSGWLSSDIIFEKKKIKKKISGKYILINSNFSACDPRFNTLENEIRGRLKTTFAKKEDIIKGIELIKKRKDEFIKVINLIFKKFPQENFILRIHPYENMEKYLFLKKKFNNFKFSYNRNLNDVLINSKLFIHVDCTTAVNANILKIKPLSMSWLIAKKADTHNYISKKVSFGFPNQNFFLNELNKILKKKKGLKFFNKKNISLLKKYYGPLDGMRCNQTAKILIKIYNKKLNKKNNYKKIKINKIHLIKENIKFLLFKFLGFKNYLILKKIINRKYFIIKNNNKNFNTSTVKGHLIDKKINVYENELNIIELTKK